MLGRRLSRPILLDGHLPSTAQAQAVRAVFDKGGTAAEYAEFVHREWRGDVSA